MLFQAGATAAGQVVFVSDYRAPGASEALNLTDPTTKRVFQAQLQSGRPDFYAFAATKGTSLRAVLNTARVIGGDNFSPALALFGPGLPPPAPSELKLLSFSLPPGAGLLVSTDSETHTDTALPTYVDEPWTGGSYWERQNILFELPQNGTYFLAVYSRTPQSGKYALTIGDEPQAGLRDTLSFPITWARVHLWFGDLGWPVFAAIGLILLGLVLVGWYLRVLARQIKNLNLTLANRQRTQLLQKRVKSGWQTRRLAKPAPKAGRPTALSRLAPAQLSTSVRSDKAVLAEEVLIEVGPSKAAHPEEARLAGANWESLPAHPFGSAVPSTSISTNGHANTNGQHEEPLVKNNSGNGHASIPSDGLNAWGQRLRPGPSQNSEPAEK